MNSFASRSLLLTVPAILVLASSSMTSSFADEPSKGSASETSSADQEAKLIATFANATLKGRSAPLKDGQLGEEKEDTYHIASVEKLDGKRWWINGRVQYGERWRINVTRVQFQGQTLDMTLPAIVKWAGDTAVLLFDDIDDIPHRYSARLLIHGDTYSGTWSEGDHGGMLYGVITRAAK
jgi:hypothetical protein